MGLFQQFPYSNFHDLNLDWLINQIKEMGNQAVLSVNGQTGDVILYQSENIVFPEVDANTWRMVRIADGHTAGVMFQNGLMYVMFDNAAERVYTVDHPPAYPVTSVDGQTGDVTVFPDAATRLPDVTDDYTNIRRQIRTAGTDHIVGIELKADKVYRMDGTTRSQIYDAMNPPPYPVTSVNGQTGDVSITSDVTSVNGQTGAVVIAVPFSNVTIPDVMFSQAVSTHEWSIGRETLDGVASIQIRTDANKAEAWVDFFTEDTPQVTYSRKLLTTDDIPSSSGVVSINGLTGVVTLYGATMPIESGSAVNTKQYIDNLSAQIDADIAWVENSNTATHNIPKGYYVIWNGDLYYATSNISIGDTLSSANLAPVSYGLANDLHDKIFLKAGDVVSTASFEILPGILSGSQKSLYVSIPISKSMEYITTATLTQFAAGVRIPNGGYMNANNYDYLGSADSVTVDMDKNSGMIKITLVNDNGWTAAVPNNTPLVCTCTYSITFN